MTRGCLYWYYYRYKYRMFYLRKKEKKNSEEKMGPAMKSDGQILINVDPLSRADLSHTSLSLSLSLPNTKIQSSKLEIPPFHSLPLSLPLRHRLLRFTVTRLCRWQSSLDRFFNRRLDLAVEWLTCALIVAI